MQEKVWKYMEKHRMVQEGDRIIAGVSGGADSVALFCLLEEFRRRAGYSLCVVHVNHGLRGEEARRDAEFVERLCRQKGIEFYLYCFDVAKMARERKLGIEEAGRLARQEAFARHLDRWKGNKVALAHHAGDLAETVLHHLCRGTGLGGLCGIRPVQGEKIRPLLCLERQEIEHYLEENNISCVHDSTNDSDAYTRNRIRRRVLPMLEAEVNSRAAAHIAGTAGILCRIEDYLRSQAEEALCRHRSPGAENLLAETFFQEEQILQEYGVLVWLEQICGGRKDLTAYHVERILHLAEKAVGKSVQLPGGFRAVRRYEGIAVLRDVPAEVTARRDVCELPVGGSAAWGSSRVSARVLSYFGQEIPEKRYTKWLNYDKIDLVPQIRTRQPGDFLVINAEGGRKLLKDYLIDCKIPREERDAIPLIALGQEILWVVGYRISEAYRIGEDTGNILEIMFEPEYRGGNSNGR